MNNIHFPDGLINKFFASLTIFFISPTPAVTAFILKNLFFVVSLITFASEVLP